MVEDWKLRHLPVFWNPPSITTSYLIAGPRTNIPEEIAC